MKLNKLFKYSFRFLFLQILLTYTTIFYFDNFLIPTKFCELCSGYTAFECRLITIYGKTEIDFLISA